MKKQKRKIWMSIHRLTYELHVHRSVINKLIRRQNLRSNEEGQYSLADIVNAMIGDPNSLENRAKEAKYGRIIEEAEIVRAKLEQYRRELIPASEVREFLAYARPILTEIFRRSRLSDQEKQLAQRTIDDMTVANLLNRRQH